MKLPEPILPLTRYSAGQFVRFFRDRQDAGARLAERLARYSARNTLVLGLARGGVVVAAEVAKALNVPLDVIAARRLGAPTSHDLAIGAVTADGGRYYNEALIRELAIPRAYVERVTGREMIAAQRQEAALRSKARPNVTGRSVILVDDGLATGAAMIAATRSVQARYPARIVVAVPIAAQAPCEELQSEADEVVCLLTPEPFWAVGLFYQDFTQVEDEEVKELLRQVR
ncbi:MAG TPA: phosphoribosyltransferase family protein [Gemmatimonadaceae bacterium]|jgi:predicted phosphoribosyltransferase